MNRTEYRRAIVRELTKANNRRNIGLKQKSNTDQWWIRCPVHSAGRERTPSLRIQLKVASRFFGGFKCFGCAFRGDWPLLAERIGADPLQDSETGESSLSNDEAFSLIDREADMLQLFGKTDEIEKIEGLAWPDTSPWRNIDGEVVSYVGGILYIDKFTQTDRLFLPVNMDGIYKGGVKANLIPGSGVNYFNTKKLATDSLLFYDEMKRMLDRFQEEYGKRVLAIVEGPRDALNLIQMGLPAVCNLGAVSSWNAKKIAPLLALNLDCLILLYDGDEAGSGASDATFEAMSPYLTVLDIELPSHMEGKKLKKAIDASDLDQQQVGKIIKKAMASVNNANRGIQ